MTTGGRNQKPNRLWLSRKRRSFRQKQVAYILNHHTADQVSRYEKGTRIPTLETALMLEIIYKAPLRVLFNELYDELQNEVRQKVESNPSLKHIAEEMRQLKSGSQQNFCTYEDVINMPAASRAELVPAKLHITKLAKKLAYRH